MSHRTARRTALLGLALAGTLSSDLRAGTGNPTPERQRIALVAEPLTEVSDILAGSPVEDDVVVEGGFLRQGVWTLTTTESLAPGPFAQLLDGLSDLDGVLLAEEDLRVSSNELAGCSLVPGGEVFPQQCTIAEVDGTPTLGEFLAQSALDQIDAPEAQELPQGYQAVVAVIDTGLDQAHPVFTGRLFSTGYDFIHDRPRAWEIADGVDDDGDGYVDEAFGHGTHIAGTVALVNPECLILPVRSLDSEGNGSASGVAAGILYAVDQGADVINLSLSLDAPSQVLALALMYAESRGVLVFTSAGNTGGVVLFPGSYDPADFDVKPAGLEDEVFLGDTIITVAGVDDDDLKADFSAHGEDVDVSAPGVAVYGPMPGGGFAWWSGTSMATAVASGAASLVLGVSGPGQDLGPHELLVQAADDIDGLNPGFAGELGSGRLDLLTAALDAWGDQLKAALTVRRGRR